MKISTDLSEILIRTISIYFSEAILGLVLFLMFLYFSKIHQRKFLFIWAYSWLALILFVLTTIWITINNVNDSSGTFILFVSILSTSACFAQAAFVLLGTYIHGRERTVYAKHLIIILIGILVFATAITVFKYEIAGAAQIRSLFRIGIKYAIVGVGFIWAGCIIMINPRFTKGLGQKIFSIALIGIGIIDFYYATIVICNFLGADFGYAGFMGLSELVFNSFIGIGMVTWLLEDERGKLKKANKQLDSFLYSTSHDLRAPIASVLGLTNLAKMELRDETSLKYFEMIESRIKKMDFVIADILQLARTTKAELKIEQIDFNKLLQEVITDVKFNKGAKAINLRYTPNASFVLFSDYTQLKIILGNLVGNAVKYHSVEQVDPFIAVRFISKQEEIIIEIEDNGTGIAKQYQKKIFNMFFRATTQSEGTGLGLYIVAEAVAKLQGKIVVQAEVGKGSIFTITLPLA